MTDRFKVVVTDFRTEDLGPEIEILKRLADVVALGATREEDLIGKIDDADALMVYHCVSLTRVSLSRLEKCRVLVRCGVGFDNVDWRYARERGIDVANVPDYGSEEVADSAVGMALSLARGIHLHNSMVRSRRGPWDPFLAAPLARLRGDVFGIVGLGRIGTAVALRAKATGMRVAFFDPYKPDGYDKALGVERCETLDDLLERSLILSLHCPLTEETRRLIDAEALKKMRRGAFLVNTARGALVETAAIPEAVASGGLAGAALDVIEVEPPPDDHPLMLAWRDPNHPAHDRVIVNPHAAFYCEEGALEMRVKAAETCKRALLGEPVRNVVN